MAWIKSFLHWGKVLFCAPKENQKSARYFRGAGSDGLRYPASTSCLGRHSCPADRGPNSSSLFPPQAAVVAVARKGLLAPFRPRRGSRNGKKLAASLNAFFSFLRFTLRRWCYLSADGKVLLKPEIFGEAVKRRRAKMRLRDFRANARISSIFAWSPLLRNC